MTRSIKFTALGIVLLVLAAAIGSAAPASLDSSPDSPLSESATQLPSDQTVESFGEPRWVVELQTSDDNATLDEWANASDDRHIIDPLDSTNRSVIAAPRSHVGTTLVQRVLNRGLAHKSYVVSVEPDLSLSRPEPVETLRSNTTYEKPSLVTRSRVSTRTGGDAAFSKTGVAWSEDATETLPNASRNATNSDAVSASTSALTIAIVDTGASTAGGRVFGNGTSGSSIRIDNASKNFITGASVNATSGNWTAIEDGNGHGTHTAATAAANHSNANLDGYAPDANLLILKALADDGSGSSHDIATAIRYAADQDADVLSLSLGSQVYSEEIAAAVEYAIDEGTVVVVAAGNSRPQVGVGVASPADTPTEGVITVAAANVSQNVNQTLPAYFSQPGPDAGTKDLSGGVTTGEGVTLSAPGMSILAPTPTTSGTVENTTLSGTSMSTPAVAAGSLQLLAADASLRGDPVAVHNRLVNASQPMPNAAEAAVGAGYLDVEAAVDGVETETQREAMTADAEAHDAALRGLSASQGGAAARAADLVSDLLP